MTLALLVTFLIAQTATGPQARAELAPGTTYDPAIPTLAAVVGHDIGDEISTPEEIAAYLRALAAAAPERTRLVEYARSWEGRPLHLLVIGAANRVSVLDQVKAGLRRLADPRGLPPAEADRLVKELPVVTWLMHAVHGDEITSCDAALAEAYHLLAARGDAGVEAILRESIVLIDPLQNPDGRARFLAASRQARAAVPDAEPYSAEQDQPWPGGRPNHYLFDMNRDWLAISQPETAGRIRIGLEWYPHVAADLHEMGGDSTYYFAPPADPANPHITPRQVEWLQRFGRENARRFDARGFGYFVREAAELGNHHRRRMRRLEIIGIKSLTGVFELAELAPPNFHLFAGIFNGMILDFSHGALVFKTLLSRSLYFNGLLRRAGRLTSRGFYKSPAANKIC